MLPKVRVEKPDCLKLTGRQQYLKSMGKSIKSIKVTISKDQVPLLLTKDREQRLQFPWAHQNLATEDWKSLAWSEDVRKCESIDKPCLVSMVMM